jgi:hypothetical protein
MRSTRAPGGFLISIRFDDRWRTDFIGLECLTPLVITYTASADSLCSHQPKNFISLQWYNNGYPRPILMWVWYGAAAAPWIAW